MVQATSSGLLSTEVQNSISLWQTIQTQKWVLHVLTEVSMMTNSNLLSCHFSTQKYMKRVHVEASSIYYKISLGLKTLLTISEKSK